MSTKRKRKWNEGQVEQIHGDDLAEHGPYDVRLAHGLVSSLRSELNCPVRESARLL
jgi:hypothetical protein